MSTSVAPDALSCFNAFHKQPVHEGYRPGVPNHAIRLPFKSVASIEDVGIEGR